MPICALCDRFTIFMLKAERLTENNMAAEILGLYQTGIDGVLRGKSTRFQKKIRQLIAQLYDANEGVWNLEYTIRMGELTEDGDLKEIGRRSLEIRKWNAKRIGVKNEISRIFGELHGLDKKIDHGSEGHEE
jgi:hypothetical protein